MNQETLFNVMAEYNLTLRHVPESEVTLFLDRGQELKANEERIVAGKWNDGSDRKMIRQTRRRTVPEWLCIIDKSFGNTQKYDHAFRGDTPEEAIMKAVRYAVRPWVEESHEE